MSDMLKKLQEKMATTNTDKTSKVKPNSASESIRKSKTTGSFYGMSEQEVEKQRKQTHRPKGSSLSGGNLGEQAIASLKKYTSDDNDVVKPMATNLLEELAMLYSQENTGNVYIEKLRHHVNSHEGNVEKEFWYMLMDAYQVLNNRESFERTAYSFAQFFSASPPSWHVDENRKPHVLAGKNILIFDGSIHEEELLIEKFKDFFKSAKIEKFSRINLNQCDFENSDFKALNRLYEMMLKLRKNKIVTTLMADNKLIDFCKSYMQSDTLGFVKTGTNVDFLNNEAFFWLWLMETLQWKGEEYEFEQIALEYAMKFEISSPGWEEQGIMQTEQNMDLEVSHCEIDSYINKNNISNLLEIIQNDLKNYDKSIVDFSKVNRLDYASACKITHLLQEINNDEDDDLSRKDVIFKHPNQMVEVLLRLSGVGEYARILPRKR